MARERDCVEHLLQVAGNRRLALQEVIALGFLVSRKWDRAKEANRQSGTSVSNIEALRFDNFTSAELAEFRAEATRALIEFGATVPSPPAKSDSWARGFWQGFAASWAYALSIALAALCIKLAGSDIIILLRELLGPGHWTAPPLSCAHAHRHLERQRHSCPGEKRLPVAGA